MRSIGDSAYITVIPAKIFAAKGISSFFNAKNIGPQVRDFYAFTRESFSLEGYTPAPFTDTIPIAI